MNSHNSIYIEFFGISGSFPTIIYDRIIKETSFGYFDLNLGFGYFPSKGESWPIVGVPISINYTKGFKNHHLECGIGLTYSKGLEQSWGHGSDENGVFKTWHNELDVLLLSTRFGYKFQKPNGGFFFRFSLTPLIKIIEFSNYPRAGTIFPSFGIGLGYTL